MIHKTVMLKEAVAGLEIKPDGVYVDATYGRGGHSAAILEKLNSKGMLVVIDKDPAAIEVATKLAANDPRVRVFQGSFSKIFAYCKQLNLLGKINGLLLDLGVSSPQLDEAARGFSFTKEGPLDMRMDPTAGESAAEWINSAKEEEISEVLKVYGEERFHRRVARAIVNARAEKPFSTTSELVDVVQKAIPKKEKHKHPATRTFQALRIKINDELQDLETFLNDVLKVLAPQGRLVVISFHSLEDRIVKQFIQRESSATKLPKEVMLTKDQMQTCLKKIGKMQTPTEEEVQANVRARSARLRVAEFIA